MKSVLISIQPKWCELIASGKKRVEVRKSRPKLDVPFKVYIYCTKSGEGNLFKRSGNKFLGYHYELLQGKVIGEFVCDVINPIYSQSVEKQALCAIAIGNGDKEYYENSCVSYKEAYRYFQNAKMGYGWHISNLVIYETPLEINDFVTEGDCTCEKCKECKYFERGNGYNVESDCLLPYQHNFKTVKPLFRSPQSWCYVESEVQGE